jgi:Zn-dependent protease
VPSIGQGALRLFRLAGIDVYLHWSWFVVALIEVQQRRGDYRSPLWNVLEYLALFAIVTLHEFGHSLACRSVGGSADHVVLWPLGGVAYVNPPQRPGATLWSIAAGPLVNVALVPLLVLGIVAARLAGLPAGSDAATLLRAVTAINLVLLVFNLLPIYPLDGGQILRSLLWFPLGRARSLIVATVVGFAGVAALALFAIYQQSIWMGLIAAFVAMSCWRGLQQGRMMLRLRKLPRREGAACPSCGTPPLAGALWKCARCGAAFDTFETDATCPACGARFAVTRCVDCGASAPIAEWRRPPAAAD